MPSAYAYLSAVLQASSSLSRSALPVSIGVSGRSDTRLSDMASAASCRSDQRSSCTSSTLHLPPRYGYSRRRARTNIPSTCDHHILLHQYHSRRFPLHMGLRTRRCNSRLQALGESQYPLRSASVGSDLGHRNSDAPRTHQHWFDIRLHGLHLRWRASIGVELRHSHWNQPVDEAKGSQPSEVDSWQNHWTRSQRNCVDLDHIRVDSVQYAYSIACNSYHDELQFGWCWWALGSLPLYGLRYILERVCTGPRIRTPACY